MQNVIYAEVMAQAKAPGIYNANGIWQIGPMIMRWASPTSMQQRWLPGIIGATEHWCQGFTEPEAGSDLANLRTLAVADGDEYVVNGTKIWTSTAHLAKWGLFLVRTDPDRHRTGRQARGHHRAHRRHGDAGRAVQPDPRDHRRGDVLRGGVHRRPRAGRLPARRRGRRAGTSPWARSPTSAPAPAASPSGCGPSSSR